MKTLTLTDEEHSLMMTALDTAQRVYSERWDLLRNDGLFEISKILAVQSSDTRILLGRVANAEDAK